MGSRTDWRGNTPCYGCGCAVETKEQGAWRIGSPANLIDKARYFQILYLGAKSFPTPFPTSAGRCPCFRAVETGSECPGQPVPFDIG